MGKPLADYNLSFPSQVVSQPIAIGTTPCTVSGETESSSSARVLDDSSQDSSTGNHSTAHIPSQSSQVGLSSVLTQPSGNEHNINMSKPLLVDTVLSFIVAFRLKGDKVSLKQVVTVTMMLWLPRIFCGRIVRYILRHVGYSFTIVVTLTHVVSLWLTLKIFLHALDTLDSSGLLPSTCCETTQLSSHFLRSSC